ncbi:MAG: aspartyl protease family protein [Lacipirellulaceae bacterium]
MGITHVTTTLSTTRGDEPAYEADFLVDTGSLHCLAPASKLEQAGIQRRTKRSYKLSSGKVVAHAVGFAEVGVLGEQTVTEVIFGPENAEPILGVIALESLGIMVDPVSQTLKRLHAFPLK